jgi:hypothetical protein
VPKVKRIDDKVFSVDLSDLNFIDTVGFHLLKYDQVVTIDELCENITNFLNELHFVNHARENELCMAVKVFDNYEVVCNNIADHRTENGIYFCAACAAHVQGELLDVARPPCQTEGCVLPGDYVTEEGGYICEECRKGYIGSVTHRSEL